MRRELAMERSPLAEVCLAHIEINPTKMSCMADSLLLSVKLTFKESFFISGPCTKTPRSFTAIMMAADTEARLRKIGLDSNFMSIVRKIGRPTSAPATAINLKQKLQKSTFINQRKNDTIRGMLTMKYVSVLMVSCLRGQFSFS